MKREKVAEVVNKTLSEWGLTKRDIEMAIFIRGNDRKSMIARDRFLLARTFNEIAIKYEISRGHAQTISWQILRISMNYVQMNKGGAFRDYCFNDEKFYSINEMHGERKKYIKFIAREISLSDIR